MPQTVCRMFATRRAADAAAEDLRLHGYPVVHVFGGATGDAGTAAAYTDALCKAYVLKAAARIMAERLAAGTGLVVLHPQFGQTAFALTLLNRHGPVDDGLPDTRAPGPRYDESAPLSSALQLPVLTRSKLPFEALSGVPSVTSKPWRFSDAMQFGLTTKSATPLSSAFGLPTLTRGGCTFSSVFGPLVLSRR